MPIATRIMGWGKQKFMDKTFVEGPNTAKVSSYTVQSINVCDKAAQDVIFCLSLKRLWNDVRIHILTDAPLDIIVSVGLAQARPNYYYPTLTLHICFSRSCISLFTRSSSSHLLISSSRCCGKATVLMNAKGEGREGGGDSSTIYHQQCTPYSQNIPSFLL